MILFFTLIFGLYFGYYLGLHIARKKHMSDLEEIHEIVKGLEKGTRGLKTQSTEIGGTPN